MISVVARVPLSTIADINARFDAGEWLSLATRAAMSSRSLSGFRNPVGFKIFDFLIDDNELDMLVEEYPEVSLLGAWDDEGTLIAEHGFDEPAWRAAQPQDPVYDVYGTLTGWEDAAELKPVHQFAGHALRTFT